MFTEHELAQLIDDLPDAIVIVDGTGVIRYANTAVEHVLGYEPAQLVGEPLHVLVPEDLRSQHDVHHARFRDAPSPRPMGTGLDLGARHRSGAIVPVEIALVPVRGRVRMTAAFVRDVSTHRSLTTRLEAKNAMVVSMTQGDPIEATMRLAASHIRTVLRADGAWIALPTPHGDGLTVVASDAVDGAALVGRTFGESRSTWWPDGSPTVMEVDVTSPLVPFDGPHARMFGAAIVARVGIRELVGVVFVARLPGTAPFTQADLEVTRSFAELVALALDLDSARSRAQKLALAAEHERIARDLHDTVIQRLFAEGLHLEAAALDAPAPVAERILAIANELDEGIREIRDTIFRLRPRAPVAPLDDEVRAMVARYADPALLTWQVEMRGDVEAATAAGLGEPMLAMLRECLANTVRHAEASRVEVYVDVTDDHLDVMVVDDGIGPGRPGSGGLGLVNLQARAIALAGTFSIDAGRDGGTVVHWRVPLSDQ